MGCVNKSKVKALWLYRDTFVALFFPLLFLPIIIIDGEKDIGDPGCCNPSSLDCEAGTVCEYDSRNVARFAYCLFVMGSFWITECIPISVTALLPYILFPLFGLVSAGTVAVNYMKNTNFLLLGGLTVAVAIETSNLHRRIALGTLKTIGSSPRRLMLGFILISWFLSMWIANTAAAAMMIPIVTAVLEELKKNKEDSGIENKSFAENEVVPLEESVTEETSDFDAESQKSTEPNSTVNDERNELSLVEKGMILCVPYACSIGGTTTLTGTAPNLVLQELWQERYPDAPYSLNYIQWLGYNIVNSTVAIILMFMYLQAWYLGVRCKSNPDQDKRVRKLIEKSWKDLGKMSQEEILVLIAFVILVLSWFFREPGFMKGWIDLFPEPDFITDGVPALFIGTILFLIPAEKTGLICGKLENGPSRSVLTWKTYQAKMNWGVLLVIGGGFAMANASDLSGFSSWFASGLQRAVEDLPTYAIAIIVSILAALFTEICSNTAATALFVPLLAELSTRLCINPLYLLLPATLACSLSFMLPAATPPNAIAYGSGKITVLDMIKSGIVANLIGILVVNAMLNSWGIYYFELDSQDFKNWTDTRYC